MRSGPTCTDDGTSRADFATMMRKLTSVRDLQQWIDRVQADDLPGLQAFANRIQRDIAAVTAGPSQPYSSDPVEGHVKSNQNDQAADVRESIADYVQRAACVLGGDRLLAHDRRYPEGEGMGILASQTPGSCRYGVKG
jgi:hypothetical protein